MVTYIRSDLDFILDQIKVAEAHAAGQPLFGPGGLVPAYTLSVGLRTVDGRDNNLLPGQEEWGAADTQFPELVDPVFRPADGTLFDPDGPGPAPAIPTSPNYNPSNDPNSLVFDKSLRMISNLIVDQSLGNPSAIIKALQNGGVVADPMASLPAVQAIHNAFQPFAADEYQSRVASANAHKAYLVAEAAFVANPTPATELARDNALLADTAAALVHTTDLGEMNDARVVRDAALTPFGITMDGDNVNIPNVAPDVGLSAPFNSWFTLFGQFFDHGLDLVNKGGSGTVFVPLQPDDPLYVPGSPTNFMVLTRATVGPGTDGIMGTADDTRPVNTTTSFVDQNQTYSSHSSHQVFLRQYEMNGAGRPVATGNLIEGGGAEAGGMATWGEVKTQARMLGIDLTDFDVGNVPLLRTDQYGNFIPNAAGFAQIIVGIGADGIPNTADDIVVSGTDLAPINPTTVLALRTGHAFLADIAHNAVPVGKIADGDIEIGLANPNNGSTEYDNELLDAHFIAGDGRVNENIGLTAVHHVFHSEHNRLAEHTKEVVLADAAAMLAGGATQAAAVAFLNEWLAVDVTEVPATPAGLVWDGNRLFQAAKFGTEMQYQHLVFEDFARKIQPNIDFFVVPDGYHADINPNIVAEFAHVVYRFGHSMLTETIDRLDPSFNPDQIGLIEAFLNPIEFDGGHTVADGIAAGAIIRGMTRQVGNEIDEFVTGALRNNLLGLPLDLATINLARGRDTGVPSLNAARRDFYEASQQAPELKPYESWTEFAANLKNEASIINFVAAYGLHPLIQAQATIEGKRAVAMAMIFNTDQVITNGTADPLDDVTIVAASITDAVDFLNSTGAWANLPNGVTITGLDVVDLWIGGLAEKILPFGGMLGSTFNFVFEVQLEKLQDGDRFYYLQRLDGLHLLAEMENNTFAKLISKNTDATHLPSDVFSAPGLILEVDRTKQYNPGLGEDPGADGILLDDPLTVGIDESADNLGNDPAGGTILTPLVIRNNPSTVGPDSNYLRYTGADHVILGGTEANDILVASEGDDTLYGDGGNDRMEGGAGNDSFIGGAGDDIITDLGGDDIIRSGSGNDAINAGLGTDLVVADEGNDFVVLGPDLLDETFLGIGNDFVLGSKTTEQSMGGEGHDWIEIGAWTGAVGDNFDDQFAADSVVGHDVFRGDGGFDEFIGEGGDDIWIGTLGRGKFDGMSGFDWATYKDNTFGTNADLFRVHFDALPLPPPNAALDEYSFVEGVSGSSHDDEILGSDFTSADIMQQGARGSVLTAEGIALISGLQAVVGAGVTSFDAGNILLGGDGNDQITGRGGNDIIDGDKWLNVRVSVRANADGTGAEIDSADSLKDLVTEIFNGTYNPGQLQIVREILTANGTGDTDTAIFSGPRADYDISFANGAVTVVHARGTAIDGTDTLRNIERMRFSDIEIPVNFPATGAPVISDLTPTEGFALTLDTSSIVDENGVGPFSYQWQSSADGTTWTNIAGATGAAFTPQDLPLTAFGAQAGLQLRAIVSFTDGFGNAETVTSAPTGPTGVNWSGFLGATFNGTAGDDIANGGALSETINGNGGNDILNGGGLNDTITGGTGNDRIDGGGQFLGVDTAVFAGTVGNYTVDTNLANNIVVTDNIGLEGTDTISGVEQLRFAGVNYTVVTGGGGNDNNLNGVNGAGGSQAVFGLAGSDTINGGTGNDLILAGAGNDTVTQAGATGGHDIVNGGTELVAAPGDRYVVNGDATAEIYRVYARADALAAGITGLTAATEIVVTRNGTNNASVIAELSEIEEITINTGLGADTVLAIGNFNPTSLNFNTITINGGWHDDVVDISGLTSDHRIVFKSNGGTDAIVGTVRPQDVFNINDLIYGTAGNDTFNGGMGDDTLSGKAGVDELSGGLGNDTFVVQDIGDTVHEAAGEGKDRVVTLIDYELAAGESIEGLVAGNHNGLNLGGNEIANYVFGKNGADRLSGGGGVDTLLGGGGTDTFVLSNTYASRDLIKDFVSGVDTLEISAALFGGGLTAGVPLSAGQVVSNLTGIAGDADDRFIYETDNGRLYFDADGTGAGIRVFITGFVPAVPSLAESDFTIV